ncbi:hypothetical protein Tco_0287632 [Tanacetum coccineum]
MYNVASRLNPMNNLIVQAVTSNWAVCCTLNPPVLPPIPPEGLILPPRHVAGEKSLKPAIEMKEEFPGWFGSQICQRHVDKDLGVSASSELFALACRPTPTPISVNSCVVNEDDPDIIHVDNSSDLALTTTLNDLEIAALHINGQSIDVDAPPDIINVDEDDDIINDEDVLPHDLADSDDEDLANVDDDDGIAVMSADVAKGHGGDGGGDDRPSPHESARGCRGKGTRKPNLGGRKAGRMHTRKETQNLRLRKITNELGPQSIWFEWKDNGTMLPLGDHSAHWANLLGEIVREFPMHFGSWRSIPSERKARVLGKIGPHMQPEIRKGIDQHLGKIYMDKNSSLKRDYWVKNPDDEIYDGLAGRGKDVLDVHVPRCNHTSDVDELKRSYKQLQKQIDMITKAMSSDDRYSQLFTQLQSQHESQSGSGCGAGEDDELGDDEDAGEDADS